MVTLLCIFVYITRLYRQYRLKHYDVPARDIRKGHRWVMVEIFPKPTYCNIEKYHIVHGAECDSCGICVADHNMKKANVLIPCKKLCTDNRKEKFSHHWVPGNLPLNSKCMVCHTDCGNLPQLSDFKCCWCLRTLHDDCIPFNDDCDLGRYRQLIIPPNCVELKWIGMRRKLVVKTVRKPNILNWSPLIIIANKKSGSKDAEVLLRTFRGYLNPIQVIDISESKPEDGLELCDLLPDIVFTVLVCGGDGTIGWVLRAIENLNLRTPPQVGMVPLGTGNDLSRVLGWGEGYTGDIEVPEILEQLKFVKPVKLDRWKIEISHEKRLGIPLRKRTIMMNNYASLGVDALVTLNFHKQRESLPWLFAHRIINKFCYFTYGTKDVLERECKHLHKKLQVELDGKLIDLPEIEGLVVLNISSWGGGVRPWQLSGDEGNFKPARYDDKMLEVMALYSSFHIAQLQVGLASPIRLGQAQFVKIRLFGGNAPMQVDGEPWEQHPAEIIITHQTQASILAKNEH
ncbi:hypothetical protein LOTGIDRAFT_110026 [Lottia gigantea]|uniref:Diacylglycerol kinase n=1 Tax=Lottia gigantea TaxID=225164 RepID=V4B0Y8_LOTGI|nr:hypothetical protein LOTGIDRAFT_110026 [Lottia gigantea]ESP03918.1 hypothetical protein LOTGIDRAFT_110026 [Lottia gigantea]